MEEGIGNRREIAFVKYVKLPPPSCVSNYQSCAQPMWFFSDVMYQCVLGKELIKRVMNAGSGIQVKIYFFNGYWAFKEV